MVKLFSQLIAWGSAFAMICVPVYGVYLVLDISRFSALLYEANRLPIQWQTVESWQLYLLWFVAALVWALAIAALYYLNRAFTAFAKGEFFNLANSRAIRFFAVLVFAQAIAKPIQLAIASVVLSINHPEGQRMLSLSVGSDTLQTIGLSMILWIVGELLVAAHQLENENQQFV